MNDILSQIENAGLCWSAARRAGNGKQVRSASPTAMFWSLWRSSKELVKAAGFSVDRDLNGDWRVNSWSSIVEEEAAADAQAIAASVTEPVVSKPAVRDPNFVAPQLDPSRNWSAEQLAIFDWFRTGTGSLVVQARAGTGKTTTIKVAFSQAPEARMLYAVFGKKNQVEAQGAIVDPRVDILTLHSLGYRYIRSVWSNSKPDNFIERERAEQAAAGAPDEVITSVVKLVGFLKNCCLNPSLDEALDIADRYNVDSDFAGMGWGIEKIAAAAIRALELSKIRNREGKISFNDMVWLPVVMGWVMPQYDGVVIDEAQDMNMLQLLMARRACKAGGRIAVVGDDRQSIYAFRGADSNGMARMAEELKAQKLGLTTTYRCPKSVVALAKALVPDYQAAEAAPEGEVIDVSEEMLPSRVEIGDAILSRANAPLMPICLGLIRKGISARIEGREIGKALAAIVKKLKVKSIPQFIGRVEVWANKEKNRFKASKYYEQKCALIDDQAATLIAVAEGVSSVKEIEDRLLALFQDSEGNPKPAVVLSSVHKAKGLEWNRVYLLSRTFRHTDSEAVTEEANIYYVAVTRAKQLLGMVSA